MNRHTRKKRKKFVQDRGLIEAQKAVDGTDRAIASQMPLDGSRAMTENLLLKDGTKPADNSAAAPVGYVEGVKTDLGGRIDNKAGTGHTHSRTDVGSNDHNYVATGDHSHGEYLVNSDLNSLLTKEEANRLYVKK